MHDYQCEFCAQTFIIMVQCINHEVATHKEEIRQQHFDEFGHYPDTPECAAYSGL